MQRLLFLSSFCLTLCFVLTSCAAPTPEMRYIVAIDRSESTAPMRLDQLHDITLVRQAALVNGAEMEMWFYDSGASRIYGPGVPNDPQAIKLQKQSYLIPDQKHRRVGTRPAALFEALDKEVPDITGKDVRLLVFTDGDNDFGTDGARIKAGAEALSKLPKLKVTVIGIHAENESWWKMQVLPALGGRLTLAPPSDHLQATGQAVAP